MLYYHDAASGGSEPPPGRRVTVTVHRGEGARPAARVSRAARRGTARALGAAARWEGCHRGRLHRDRTPRRSLPVLAQCAGPSPPT